MTILTLEKKVKVLDMKPFFGIVISACVLVCTIVIISVVSLTVSISGY